MTPLLSPDIVAEARGLSPGVAGLVLAAGLLLWGLGWRWHQFWVVFAVTLGAGVAGLSAGRSAGGPVLVAGVLLAVAAGVLALELAKLLAFVSGGAAAWVAATAVLPQAQELWAVFLSGGLVGVVLYRLWAMLATSAAGVLLAGHAGLVLWGEVAGVDAAGWSAAHALALNGGVLLLAVAGVVVQAKTAPADEAGRAAADDPAAPFVAGKEKNPKKPVVLVAAADEFLADAGQPKLAKAAARPRPAGWGLRLVPRFQRAA